MTLIVSQATVNIPELIVDYLATERIPSYFELETQVFPEGGHVCRFDSVSKLLSAGIRLVSSVPFLRGLSLTGRVS